MTPMKLALKDRCGAFLAAFHVVVNFHGALVEQEQAAGDQDDVAPGQVEPGDGDDRVGELGQPHQHGQHDDAQDERAHEADTLGELALFGREPLRGNRQEDEIVYAEDDFQNGERCQAEPALHREYPVEHRVPSRRSGGEIGSRPGRCKIIDMGK